MDSVTSWMLDRKLLYTVMLLLGMGLVQVYSASFVFATDSYNDGLFFFKRQAVFVFAGFAILMVTAHLRWSLLHLLGLIGFVVSALAVAITLLPEIGIKVGGARRWLPLVMGFRFEPAEFFKFFLPFWLALAIYTFKKGVGLTGKLLIVLGLILPLMALLRQPDFGTFVLCLGITLGCAFSFGLPIRYFVASLVAVLPGLYYLVLHSPYRSTRLMSFLDPWADADKSGFQLIQSMLSLHKGGFTGVGLGQGQGKLFFLPEAHNDFTVAVLGEEMGFLGLTMVLLLYGLFLVRSVQLSLQLEDERAQVVGLGVSISFALSTFFNFAVALGLVPTKGLALPFMSYGGSSLIASCFAVGVLLSLDRESQLNKVQKRFKAI